MIEQGREYESKPGETDTEFKSALLAERAAFRDVIESAPGHSEKIEGIIEKIDLRVIATYLKLQLERSRVDNSHLFERGRSDNGSDNQEELLGGAIYAFENDASFREDENIEESGGFHSVDQNLIVLFEKRLQSLAEELQLDFRTVVLHVLAHELAHAATRTTYDITRLGGKGPIIGPPTVTSGFKIFKWTGTKFEHTLYDLFEEGINDMLATDMVENYLLYDDSFISEEEVGRYRTARNDKRFPRTYERLFVEAFIERIAEISDFSEDFVKTALLRNKLSAQGLETAGSWKLKGLLEPHMTEGFFTDLADVESPEQIRAMIHKLELSPERVAHYLGQSS